MEIGFGEIINSLYEGRDKTLDFLSELFSFWHSRVYIALVLMFNGLAWFLSAQLRSNFPEDYQAVLHYNVDFGVSLIGPTRQIFVIPAIGDAVFIVNIVVLYFLSKIGYDKRFFRHLLLSSALFVNVFLLISVVVLHFFNIEQ